MKRINEVKVLNTSTGTEFRVAYELESKSYDLNNVPNAVIRFIQNSKTVKVKSISSACTLYYR